jgi:hypothetical protein
MKTYNILQKNPRTIYKGSHYAITARGGFEINTISEIKLKPLLQFGKYDLTNAVQLLLKKNIINAKLGEYINGEFSENSVRLTVDDFQFDNSRIISLGSLESVYTEFKHYIYDYFKMSLAIHIFNEQNIDIFDRTELCKMINENRMSGFIEIIDCNSILKTLLESNICGNRENALIEEGFIEGDILFIPNGLSIFLSVDCGLDQLYQFDISIRID